MAILYFLSKSDDYIIYLSKSGDYIIYLAIGTTENWWENNIKQVMASVFFNI